MDEILEKYPVGTLVTDCFGGRNCRIMTKFISLSSFHPMGTIVLGHHHIYDPVKDVWAKVQDEWI